MASDAIFHPDVTSAAGPGPLVLFDGVCNLCSWSVQFLARRDRGGSLWYAAMQSATGQAILERYHLPASDYDSFLLFDDGHLYAKSRAFFRVVRYMRYPWPLLRFGMILPRRFSDWLYDRVAKNRYAMFGKKPACMIPRPEIAARFLD
jgi:predicted DCC family thiol-disulfide oxidoreductase YuxK